MIGQTATNPVGRWDTLQPEPLLPWKHRIVRAFLSWSVLAVCLSLEALAVHKIGFAAVAGMTRQERLDELFSDFAREAPDLAVGGGPQRRGALPEGLRPRRPRPQDPDLWLLA